MLYTQILFKHEDWFFELDQIWYLLHICYRFATFVNHFFGAVLSRSLWRFNITDCDFCFLESLLVLVKFMFKVVLNLSLDINPHGDSLGWGKTPLKLVKRKVSDQADSGFSISTWKSCNTQKINMFQVWATRTFLRRLSLNSLKTPSKVH